MNPTSKVFADFFKDETNLSSKAELLMDKMLEGHICIPLDIEESKALQKSKFVYNNTEKQPFIIENSKLYLQRYFEYETSIIQRIKALIDASQSEVENTMQKLLAEKTLITQLFTNDGPEIDWQLIAALNACLHNFAIITGGPGTGKTTTVSKLLCILLKLNPSLRITLAAPTGKAAMRMKESLSNSFKHLKIDTVIQQKLEIIQPQTIHRLLGYIKDSPYFKHHADNQLQYDLIVIDEASMIDIPMMSKLLEATNENTKILFLGDKNQLASVEAGSVFSDFCSLQSKMNTFNQAKIDLFNSFVSLPSQKLNIDYINNENHFFAGLTTELQVSRRFNSEEGIGYFSKSVIDGKTIEIDNWKSQPTHIQKGITLFNELADLNQDILQFSNYINEPDINNALQLTLKIRVLCAVKEGIHGVKACNQYIEKVLTDAGLIQPKYGFYENQLIMITSNNYGLSLFNGDIGIVRKDKEGNLKAFFEDANQENGLKIIATSYIKSYETAFAMTIHKSQGSEFDTAIVIMPDNEAPILTRELLYTGITRAKTMAKILVKQDILDFTINQQVQRISGIQDRIKQWV
ncbi:MAG: hypothetical protein RLZZ175_1527 [Bacteroidota bacterium]|jgi:exodeoxyribonuclease V alpha subunit